MQWVTTYAECDYAMYITAQFYNKLVLRKMLSLFGNFVGAKLMWDK